MKLKSKTIGTRIKEARVARGITQAALAEACNLSIKQIGEIERDRNLPRKIPTFALIIKTLDIDPDVILFGETSITKSSNPINDFLESLGSAENGAIEIARQFDKNRCI